MKKGDTVEFSSYGFNDVGDPNSITLEKLSVHEFIGCNNNVKLIGINEYKVIKVVDPECCKIIDEKGEKPLMG